MEPVKALTDTQTSSLIDHFTARIRGAPSDLTATRNAALCLLMLDAGLRVGEVVHLCWGDLWISDAPVHTLHVRPEIAKLRFARYVPLTGRIQAAVTTHYNTTKRRLSPHPTHSCFTGHNSTRPLTTRQVHRIIAHAGSEVLKMLLHPHMLRHTFACRLMQTTSTRVIQTLLGHKNLASTQVYTHPNFTDLRTAIDTLSIDRRDKRP